MRRLVPALVLALIGSAGLLAGTPASAQAACAADAKAGFARVQVWKDANCAGGSMIVPQEADDDRPDFARFRNYDGKVFDIDNSRSSLGVAAGYCVRIFDGSGYRGESSALECGEGATGYRNLGTLNDRVTSMKVCPRADTAKCAGAPPPSATPTPAPTPGPAPSPTPGPAPPPPPPPIPNGTPATPDAQVFLVFSRGRSRRTVSYGSRPTATAIVRTPDGAPITGAVLSVFARELRTGTRMEYRREVTTGADGRVAFTLPRGPSRTIQVQYRARDTDPIPVASASLRLAVRAELTLRVSPQRVRPGRRVRLSGTVLGAPRPPRGKLVALQAYERGRWRTFRTARASRRTGRYAVNYRFSSRARGSFRMRAQSRVEATYPYALGYSSRRRVRVG